MWLRPVNEMIELVSGMPTPQFGDESSWVQVSEFVKAWSGSVRCFRLPQVEDNLRPTQNPPPIIFEVSFQYPSIYSWVL
jgi:hypothetical protein